jgi:hypothetical protein
MLTIRQNAIECFGSGGNTEADAGQSPVGGVDVQSFMGALQIAVKYNSGRVPDPGYHLPSVITGNREIYFVPQLIRTDVLQPAAPDFGAFFVALGYGESDQPTCVLPAEAIEKRMPFFGRYLGITGFRMPRETGAFVSHRINSSRNSQVPKLRADTFPVLLLFPIQK